MDSYANGVYSEIKYCTTTDTINIINIITLKQGEPDMIQKWTGW